MIGFRFDQARVAAAATNVNGSGTSGRDMAPASSPALSGLVEQTQGAQPGLVAAALPKAARYPLIICALAAASGHVRSARLRTSLAAAAAAPAGPRAAYGQVP
jgi:hypothetical protein